MKLTRSAVESVQTSRDWFWLLTAMKNGRKFFRINVKTKQFRITFDTQEKSPQIIAVDDL